MADVRIALTSQLSEADLERIRRLLYDAFDGEFSDQDWDHTIGGWHVVVAEGDQVHAHAGVIARTLEVGGQAWRTGYVEGVGVAPVRQGEGFGTLAMRGAATVIHEQFEFGALSTGEHHFYERLGWERWRGPTFVRQGEQLHRTPDEDDGVMVLRFGASADLDLTGEIACEARAGDDW